ncbi:hypothetical protein BDP27DRAFT_1371671 [Rhodocollybia butyracea]|uniref:Uncharacterized protein n=1 Tax=Rhodocollybia butyracea TaxID=206335 RepID=A0A9P5TXZ3_9AGAR|nr:hypothetical protein BDP27DRAFT_1371671 [Rhodocollybia butyracea]
MSTTPKPKLKLSKLVFKIEAIKLKLDNPPKSGKISITLRAKNDNTLDENGGFAKGSRQKVDSEMQWEINSNIVVDPEGAITVDIKEHHRTKPLSAKSLVSDPLSLKHEIIFDKFVKSGVTGDTQEFILTGTDLTIILCISAYSLDHILKTFSPPESIVSKLGKYQAGLEVILQIATALGGLNAAAGAVLSAATQAFEMLARSGSIQK